MIQTLFPFPPYSRKENTMDEKIKEIIVKAWELLEAKNEEVPLGDLLEEIQKKLPHMTENDLLDYLSNNPIF
jgi:hypothetical protein